MERGRKRREHLVNKERVTGIFEKMVPSTIKRHDKAGQGLK